MPLMSITEYAALTAKKRTTIAALLAELDHETGKKRAKMYPSEIALPVIYAPPQGQVADLSEARARLATAQSITSEMKNAQTAKELVPAEIVELTLTRLAAQISAILKTIPSKVGRVSNLSKRELELIQVEVVKAQNLCVDLQPIDV